MHLDAISLKCVRRLTSVFVCLFVCIALSHKAPLNDLKCLPWRVHGQLMQENTERCPTNGIAHFMLKAHLKNQSFKHLLRWFDLLTRLFFGLTNLSLGPCESNGKAIVHAAARAFIRALIWAVMGTEEFPLATKTVRNRRKSELWGDLTDKQISGLVPWEEKHQQRVQREKSGCCNGLLLQWWISQVMPCACLQTGDCFTTLLAAHAQGTPQERESGCCRWDDVRWTHLESC